MEAGMRVRLSQKGLQYAADIATDQLSAQIRTLNVEEQHGKADVGIGKVEYKFSSIRTESFTPPRSTITTDPFTWRMQGAFIAMAADWRCRFKVWKATKTFEGRLRTELGLEFAATIGLGKDDADKATIQLDHCDVNVHHVKVDFHGGESWLPKLFKDKIEKAICKGVERNIRKKIEELINKKAKSKLETAPYEVKIEDNVVLDYKLTTSPECTHSHIDFNIRGEFKDPSMQNGFQFNPSVLPNTEGEPKMISFFISQHSLESLFFTMFHQGKLAHTLTKTDLPEDKQSFLNTTSTDIFQPCIANIVPEVGVQYPEASLKLQIEALEVPEIDFSTSGINVNWKGILKYSATKDGSAENNFLFSTHFDVAFSIGLDIVNDKLTYKVKDFSFHVTHSLSTIGQINKEILGKVLSIIIQMFVIAKVNKRGGAGVRLPCIKDVQLAGAQITHLLRAAAITADLNYVPKDARQ